MTYAAIRTRRLPVRQAGAPVPPRDTGSAQPRHDGNPQRPKAPSFLAQAKADLTDLVDAQLEHSTISPANVDGFLEILWPLVGKKLAASYWNGVRDGASGHVKPKERQASPAAEPAAMTYVVSGTWQSKAPRRGAHAESR